MLYKTHHDASEDQQSCNLDMTEMPGLSGTMHDAVHAWDQHISTLWSMGHLVGMCSTGSNYGVMGIWFMQNYK